MAQVSRDFDRKVWRALIISGLFVGAIYLAYLLRTPLTWLAVAFFLALAIEPAVQWFQRRLHFRGRGAPALIIILLVLAVVIFAFVMIVPPLINQTRSFIHSAPRYVESLQQSNNGLVKNLRDHGQLSNLNLNSQKVLRQVSNHRSVFFGAASSVASVATAVITILVLTFFVVLELPRLSSAFWRYQPPARRRHRQELAARMHRVIIGSVNGNLLTSLIAGVFASIVLAILHIPYAISLGVLVGLLDLIPLIGASLGAVAVIIIALLYGGPIKAVILAIYFFIYQRIENNTLQPLVYQRTVNISPLLALVAAICGARLAGLFGALFAIPAAAILQVLVKDYLENHRSSS